MDSDKKNNKSQLCVSSINCTKLKMTIFYNKSKTELQINMSRLLIN